MTALPTRTTPVQRLLALFSVTVLVLLGALGTAGIPARAQNPTGVTASDFLTSESPSAPPSEDADPVEENSGATMLVLDSSGSMNVQDAGGQTRLDAAKDATKSFVNELGGTIPLGLVTYGGTVDEAPENQEEGCRDIHVVSGPKKDVGDSFTGPIDALQARGYTPIGDSLKKAAEELGGQHGTIVLVSDGIDTCAPPPVCEVAKELHEQGIDLVINTIGFNVDEEARKELSCIADAAGGEYLDADDADSLAAMIKKAAGRAANLYESTVEQIEGSEDISQPTELPRWESGEDFIFRAELDAPPNGGEDSRTDFHAESWSIPVKPGERYVATMYKTLEGPVGTPNSLFMKTFFGDGTEPPTGTHGGDEGSDECTADSDSAHTGNVSDALPSANAYTYEIGSENCQGDLVLTAMRAGEYKADELFDVEILLHRVDPVSNMDELVSGLSSEMDGELHANANGAEQMAPGNWFDNAAELRSGQTIETDIVQGEAHVYKVPMKEGQQLAAAIRAGEVSDERALQYSGLNVSILNPVREKAGEREFVIWPNEGDEGSASAAKPTAFANRFSSDAANSYGNANWLEGDYYIVVTLDAGKQTDLGDSEDNLTDKRATMKYYLTSKVLGDPIQGPEYEPVSDKTEEPQPLDANKQEAKDQARSAGDASGKKMSGLIYALGAAGLILLIAFIGLVAFLLRGRGR
ncbi:vWA domain-containing protein [Corynebacterium minutissimum]|uniref:Putative secreted protein n=1 Tax=Corynebacterium minutissimum TaxID=38301 RepID=A0A376D056_9CORY|nr:VWA domain-containing protein [Corynebacterium minutissimum]QRP61162.1 VWA domain-containing protein [Corynebacterium minutissimum]STC78723.1 putative secreted protein [Corynebacterium minutissimum]